MPQIRTQIIFAVSLFVPAICLSASPTRAAPDLIINVNDSVINAGSCDTNSPIASGRIAIKNQGDDPAALRVTERFTRSMVAVYVPESIDLIDKKTERERLDPFDQEGVEFEVGNGVVKRGRLLTPPDLATSSRYRDRDREREREERIDRNTNRGVQRALDKLGFDPGDIDGIIGRNTRAAIRAFQESIDASQTGRLTSSQRETLFDRAGTSDTSTSDDDDGGGIYGAQGPVTVRLYAVVDPYNLVEESDESNNLQAFELEIDCGR